MGVEDSAYARTSRRRATMTSRRVLVPAIASFCAIVGCWRSRDAAQNKPDAAESLVVYNAAALARPVRAVLDSFEARTGVRGEQVTYD
jgi:ABC-type molybdate transport system substrate-binding protein